jgi:hypothetical protein
MAIPIPDLTSLFTPSGTSPIGQPPQGDPYAALQGIINNLNNQPIVQTPPPGALQTILDSLAQGAAVLASPDPGAVLSGQIKQRKEERLMREQALQRRQDLVNQAKLQLGFQQATDLSKEQASFREEQRRNATEIAKEGRQIKLFKQQKDIENESAKSLAQWNEEFEAKNEPARLRRIQNKAIIDLLPDKFKQAAIWEADVRALMPNADPNIIQSIIDKKSGINPEPINTKEQEFIVKVNEAHFKEAKEIYELNKEKTKADITESKQRGQAALIGANAALISAKNTAANNTMANWATKQKLDIMETQFYKTPSGSVVSIDEVNKLPLTEKFQAIALNTQENTAEQQRRIQQINQAVGQSQKQTNDINKQLQLASGQQFSDAEVMQALEYARQNGKTPEQTKLILKASGATDDQINRLMGTKPVANAPSNIKTIGGSSVPIPNFGSPSLPAAASGITEIPSNMLMLLQNMFKRNTPEENLKALEEQRKRGSFK